MTLKNDILALFSTYSKLRNRDIKNILRKEPRYKRLRGSGLIAAISDKLTKLRADGYIEKVEERMNYRAYRITEKGSKEAKRLDSENLKTFLHKINNAAFLELLDIFKLEYAWLLHERRPEGMKINLDVELDQLKKRVIEEYEKRMRKITPSVSISFTK